MNNTYFIYLLILAGSTYLIRAIPFALVTRKIENGFINSFLFYIPYTVLAVMTLPAALYETTYVLSAIIGLVVAVFVSLKGKSLTVVAATACLTVFITECLIKYLPRINALF